MSQRIADAVDAYEEFLTVKWVLDAIDGCELYLNRHRKTFYDRPYFVLPDYPEIAQRCGSSKPARTVRSLHTPR
jgi:hypothetical protein